MCGVFHLTQAASRCQQGLGGHAATVDAGAANVMALDDRNLHALYKQYWSACACRPFTQKTYAFHCVDGGTVATNTAADDDEVIVVLGGDCGVACEGSAALQQHPARACVTYSIRCMHPSRQSRVAKWSRLARVPLGSAGQELCHIGAPVQGLPEPSVASYGRRGHMHGIA